MTNKPTAAGYMIQDIQGNLIFGIGSTVDEAWAMVVDGAGPFYDADGDEIDDEVALATQFKVYGASAALMEQVEADGGAIAWRVVRGVGVTVDEEADALNMPQV